ncbi:MAG: transporter substrate-binding protein [Flavipsychrobacter sp.]|nr:transporter substrate-binding protein [Flavipsychrobacter sp.]
MYRQARLIAITVWLCCAVCFSMYSCRSSQADGADNVFYMNLSSGVLESMDPAFAKALYMMWTAHMLYNTLVETDEDLHLVPSLARSWDVSDDGLVYTFHLRNDVYFHNAPQFPSGRGRRMVAGDVVYSFNRLIDPKVASTGAWIFNGRVTEKEPFVAIDDTTVQIRLIAPFRPLPAILSMPYCSIVPREVAEHWGKDFRSHPCGTGPFQLKHWDEGNIIVLHKNPRYWEKDNTGKRLPYVDAVHISCVDSKATEFFLFLQGKLDFVNGLDGSFKDLILSKNGELKQEYRGKFKLRKSTYLDTEYLGFLTDSASPVIKNTPLKNVLVRQAINYAIDREKIVTYFRNGIGIPATSGFIPAGVPGYDTSGSYGYNYNPAKSIELLKKAGYPNGKGLTPIKILTPDNWSDVINFVATQLQEVGIPVQVEVIQPNILKQEMSRSQAMFFRAQWIADYPDAETYLTVFNSRMPAPPNYTRFNNKAFDQLYDESMNAPDTMRWELYKKLDSLAISQAPLVPLYYDQLLHFTQNRIEGMTANPMNLIDLKRVRIVR